MPIQRTLVIIKPDAVQRGLVGAITQRFEQKGLRLVALKLIWSPEERFRHHYADLQSEAYFPSMVKYMSSGPVVPMVWEGANAVNAVRSMIGSLNAAPGTIRGDYCTQDIAHGTVVHASDSIKAADREITLWFSEDELVNQSCVSKTENIY